eukprot:scaffold77457_cov66-Phaeocystis_antarctica.AAC.4
MSSTLPSRRVYVRVKPPNSLPLKLSAKAASAVSSVASRARRSASYRARETGSGSGVPSWTAFKRTRRRALESEAA